MRHRAIRQASVLVACLRLSEAYAAAPRVERADTAARSPQGLLVIAFPGAADAAWPLARAVYSDEKLRSERLTESAARVLAGEPPSDPNSVALREVASMVAALRDDGAPSRALLSEIARRFEALALVTVRTQKGSAIARVFLPEAGDYDAATYSPDGPEGTWSRAVLSFERSLSRDRQGPDARISRAPPLSTQALAERDQRPSSRQFYESGWFWAALGGAALIGGGIYLATRDSSSQAIHLEVQVPHP